MIYKIFTTISLFLLSGYLYFQPVQPTNPATLPQGIIDEIKPLENPLGSLAFPPSTVEGTSTAGWTDDGSIVRLNTSSDFVGIGTSNPAQKLTVSGGNLLVSGSGQFGTTLYSIGDLSIGGGDLNLGSGSATSTLTSASGKMGVGTTTPAKTFSVQGDVYVTGTTTTAGLNNASSTMSINNVSYAWTASQGAVNSLLTNDGSGGLVWGTAAFGKATSTIITNTGTSTWQVPTGITRIKVTMVGGGGGGGSARTSGTSQASGGGGGGTAYAFVAVTAGQGIPLFVGYGGQGGTVVGATANNGVTGSSTVFFATSTVVRAEGGTGGNFGDSTTGAAVAGGTTSGANLGIDGEIGQAGLASVFGDPTGGKGGNTPFGYGGAEKHQVGNGNVAQGYGGGGGGAVDNNTGNRTGGNGKQGFILIEWIES